MKILVLMQGHTTDDQPSYHYSFLNAVSQGERIAYRVIPYLGFVRSHGAAAFWDEVLRVNREFGPDVVFFQFYQHVGFPEGVEAANPSNCIESLRKAPNHPLIFGSQGDPFQANHFRPWVRVPTRPMMELVRQADAFFTTSMGTLADYFVRHGGRNVIFLPHAYATQNFNAEPTDDISGKTFDAVMVSSIGINRFRPLGSAIQVARRWADATALWKRYGKRFAVYGRGWKHHPAYRGVLPFGEQVKVFRSSVIGVDACAPVNEVYYASDRPFFIAGSSACLVQRYTPRFEKVLPGGICAEYGRSAADICAACDKLLAMDDSERQKRVSQTVEMIKARHMVHHRVDTILSTAEAIRMARQGEMSAADALRYLRLWHFPLDVNLEDEYRYAIANWQA